MKKFNREISLIAAVVIFLSSINIAYAFYDPRTGRFNQMDRYAGDPYNPQTLHKYLYCNADPINNIDPSGNMTIAETISTMTIGQIMIGSLAATYATVPQIREQVNDAVAYELQRLVDSTGRYLSLEETYQRAKDKVRQWDESRRTRRGELYLHYSYRQPVTAASLVLTGLWPTSPIHPEGSFATRDIYLTGWMAKDRLALRHINPPDAAYLVWPKRGYEPTAQGPVTPKVDYAGKLMNGGGYQFVFGKGSGGFLTVFGPVPIKRGNMP